MMRGEAEILPGAQAPSLPTFPEVKSSYNCDVPGSQQAFLQVGRQAQGVSEHVSGSAETKAS